ncbi:uncharacterized protein N0V89_004739 [Didymosphaeria variabile]|uniref:Heterokaryon incompatibility domain-containing protein n=1 Tax=Didymosphaeria variabile TaxID=1932322 RepID=A0A9W8XSR8_9PLEO|nr:uncharacterized protein N0V89_004739 [Didymosphaeria variabile]KAJ4356703.1 hypothetical protein N0V89_004739 [Didymosphaeria variabile]
MVTMLSSNEFRVFDLFPLANNGDSKVLFRGRTRVLPLPTDESYETLSYVWGQNPPAVMIEVDGYEVAITPTLAAALKRLQLPDRPRTLWIDQLCIAQADDAEKANQVPRMGQIYSSTARCLIWMGDVRADIAMADAASAFDLLTYMVDEADATRSKPLEVPSCLASEEAVKAAMEALSSILIGKNPWWERIWTLQEVILPSKALMVWGPLSIDWAVLAAGHNIPSLVWPHIDTYNQLVSQVRGLQFARRKTESPIDIAFRWGFRKATHPLDKVYGFLGLFPPGTLKRAGNPDYDLPAAKLYSMFTVDMIECEKDLQPIALWSANHFPQSTPNMPSWAFDMSNPARGFGDLAVRMNFPGSDNIAWFLKFTYPVYSAAGDSDIDWDQFSFDPESGRLNLTGQLVDSIHVVGAPLESDNPDTKDVPDREVIARIKGWRQQIEHVYREKKWPDGSEGPTAWLDSFWRGLIGNLAGAELTPERYANEEDIAAVQRFVEAGQREPISPWIFATMTYRTVALTESGRVMFLPRHSLVGDQVWLLHGGKVPFVLRPLSEGREGEGAFRFIGPAYVDGIMHGEAFREGSKKSITLV